MRPDGKVVYVTCEGDNSVVAVDTTTLKEIARSQDRRAAARRRVHARRRPRVRHRREQRRRHGVRRQDAQGVRDDRPAAPRRRARSAAADGRGDVTGRPDALRLQRPRQVDLRDRRRALKVTRTFDDIGARPWGIGISPDGKMLYTANGSSGDVSVVDAATGQVVRRIATGGSPWGYQSVPRIVQLQFVSSLPSVCSSVLSSTTNRKPSNCNYYATCSAAARCG